MNPFFPPQVTQQRWTAVPLAFAAALLLTAPAFAQAQEERERAITAPPAIYNELVACKDIADPTARLACYDEKVAALQTAQSNNEVVIADREQVREARRGLFGLSLPRIRLFGGGDEGAAIQAIESTITRVRKRRDGKYVLTLEDGATWQQTDPARSTMRRPKSGDSISIKRAALGSFLAKVNNGRGFKVKRIVN